MTRAEWSSEVLHKERIYDQEWIEENMYLFDPLARDGFSARGRGAIVVSVAEFIQRKYADEGHPFNYFPEGGIELPEQGEFWVTEGTQLNEVQKMIQTYDPSHQFVIVLDKYLRRAAYQHSLAIDDEFEIEIRGAYATADREERQNRLASSESWGRDFRLASRYAPLWGT